MASHNNFYGNIVDSMFSRRMVTELSMGIAVSGTNVNKGNIQYFIIRKENTQNTVRTIRLDSFIK